MENQHIPTFTQPSGNQYAPLFTQWDFLGGKGVTADEMVEFIKSFIHLVQMGEALGPLCAMHIGGNITGHEDFEDGQKIATSSIDCVWRIGTETVLLRPDDGLGSAQPIEAQRTLMMVETHSFSQYYFYIDDASDITRRLLLAYGLPIEYVTGNGYHPLKMKRLKADSAGADVSDGMEAGSVNAGASNDAESDPADADAQKSADSDSAQSSTTDAGDSMD